MALTNVLPAAANATLSQITQIAVGNGYVAGGNQATQVSSSQTAGTYKLVLNDPTFLAAGGAIAPFRYCILFNDTALNDELIGWIDTGATQNIADANSFVVDFDASLGILTLA